MKTLGRIVIILVVFSAVAGLMVIAVDASGASAPDFDGPPQFRPGEGLDPNEGFQPPERGEERQERGEMRLGNLRMLFGFAKNMAVIGVLVAAITLPKAFFKRQKKQAAINSANGQSLLKE